MVFNKQKLCFISCWSFKITKLLNFIFFLMFEKNIRVLTILRETYTYVSN